ncbi:hypothetical protein QBC36DRAFT_49929 [Triangularia setosa]|uniref:Secreted protein n=1 Tax=Triangularia setosa TaxID=2587417 RepID=A0AAN6WDJ6_9PEZI|nr:hypothetical protein QBC36DRAFT_49929 [Podospora setosa]
MSFLSWAVRLVSAAQGANICRTTYLSTSDHQLSPSPSNLLPLPKVVVSKDSPRTTYPGQIWPGSKPAIPLASTPPSRALPACLIRAFHRCRLAAVRRTSSPIAFPFALRYLSPKKGLSQPYIFEIIVAFARLDCSPKHTPTLPSLAALFALLAAARSPLPPPAEVT